MKKGLLAFLAGFLVFLLFANLFGFNSIGYATIFIQQQGNKINYKIDDSNNIMQCLDSDSSNNVFVKGMCHTQLNVGKEIYGINSADYCKNEGEVVEYYCSSSFVCSEVVKECSIGFVCDSGKCIRSFRPYRIFNFRNLINEFRSVLVKTY